MLNRMHTRILFAITIVFILGLVAPRANGQAAANGQTTSGQTANAGATMPYKTGKPADFPPESDAVVAAPKNHRVIMENERVRVLDVTVAPGEKENVHSHRWPSVLYIISAGDFIDRDGEGHVIFDTRTLKEPLKYPLTMWKEPEAPHSAENLSKTVTIHLIRVEMKK